MYSLKDLLLAFLCGGLLFALGVWTEQQRHPRTVRAQSNTPSEEYLRYEVQSHASVDNWYAIKLDRKTGQVWTYDAEGRGSDDDWHLRPEHDDRKK